MSVLVTEKFESRQLVISRDGLNSSIQIVCNIRGTSDERIAYTAANNFTPDVWGTGVPPLYKQRISVQYIGPDMWEANVQYDTTAPEPVEAEDSFEFDTTGGTQRITQSLSTVASYPGGAPDYKGAIGVSDSAVEGVDITVPQLTFSDTRYKLEVSEQYRLVIFALTGTVNLNSFRGFEPGEVLFLGANVRKNDSRYSTPWVLNYRFAVSRTRSNFQIGDITITKKRGWDFLWVRYEQKVDDTSSALVRVPKSVYIEQVYESGDFAFLGID